MHSLAQMASAVSHMIEFNVIELELLGARSDFRYRVTLQIFSIGLHLHT
jgi:hypothetical protein